MISLLILKDQKKDNSNLTLVIMKKPTKIIYYKKFKINIDTTRLLKKIVDIFVRHKLFWTL